MADLKQVKLPKQISDTLNSVNKTISENKDLKINVNSNIVLEYFFLQKVDIFCSILNNNESEAKLLNSIFVESENKVDNYYQQIFSLITNSG